MAAGFYVFALVILVALSTNYATSDALEWPEQCKGKYYCGAEPKPLSYPNETWINFILNRDMFGLTWVPGTDMGIRQGLLNDIKDVANCDTQKNDMFGLTWVPGTDMGIRQGLLNDIKDVAKCDTQKNYVNIYAIKDENDMVWYVPQAQNFSVSVDTFECMYPGRVTNDSHCGLDSQELNHNNVYCTEQRVAFMFPVLSQDFSKLETELKSPKGGLPLSCSAKILKAAPQR